MKKKCILLLLIITVHFLSAQDKIIIEYDYNFANMHELKAFSVSDKENSYFFFSNELNANFHSLSETEFKSVNQYYIYKYNFVEQLIYQRIFMLPSSIKAPIPKLGTEKLVNLDWNITNQSKEILGYKVFLATTNFRGRNYKAWFANELAINTFPWKLKGLPGAILEFEDDEGYIKGMAKTVSLNSNEEFPNKVLKYFLVPDTTLIVPFRKVIEFENEVLDDVMNKEIANLPKGANFIVPNIRDMSLEKSFEWETQPAKP